MRSYSHPGDADKETGTERFSEWPSDTEPIGGKLRLEARASSSQIQVLNLDYTTLLSENLCGLENKH